MIPIAIDNSFRAPSSVRKTASLRIVRGREVILKLKPKLVSLCERCQHKVAMDYLEYFLSWPQLAKNPTNRPGYLSKGIVIAYIFKQSRLLYVCFRYVRL